MRWRRNPGSENQERSDGPSTVDVVAIAPDGETVELFLIAPPTWSDRDEDLLALNRRIHDCAAFVLDGQMHRDFDETVGRPWRIVIDWRDASPAQSTQSWVREIGERVAADGGSLEQRNA